MERSVGRRPTAQCRIVGDVCQTYRVEVVAAVQARMSSKRLPGKSLAPLAGSPSILRQLERLRQCQMIDEIVLLTSTDPTDDLLAEVVGRSGTQVVRGPLLDVLSRYTHFVQVRQPTVLVRITGDCPLISPHLTDLTIRAFLDSGADYASNAIIATLPDGLDVECMKADLLPILDRTALLPLQREHVTRALHTGAVPAKMLSVETDFDLGHLRWTLDTMDDYRFIRDVYERCESADPVFDLDDILGLIDDGVVSCPANTASDRVLAKELNLMRVNLDVG